MRVVRCASLRRIAFCRNNQFDSKPIHERGSIQMHFREKKCIYHERQQQQQKQQQQQQQQQQNNNSNNAIVLKVYLKHFQIYQDLQHIVYLQKNFK